MNSNKYDTIAAEIKNKIYSGEIKPGAKIESENVLSETYKVSRQTIRKALAILINEGLIESKHGKGTFCRIQSSKSMKTKNIAVVITYINDYIFPLILKGIYDVLDEQKYSIILKSTSNGRDKERACLEDILLKDIDGLIIEPSKSEIACKSRELLKRFNSMGIPYVFIQSRYNNMEDKPVIKINDEKGARILTRHLIDLGHKNIAGIFQADITQGVDRHGGYAKTLQENGLIYDPDKVIWFHVEDKFGKLEWAVEALLKSDRKIDAIVCYNDMIAYKVIEVLNGLGIRVPEDISITGYDAQAEEEIGAYKLTSVTHPKEKLGKKPPKFLWI
ncbi:MAG: GntR family transcriptional regulator [Clostridiales bacterium]|nr:GntR family transcriptional regulator [Clostridiales bacterium]